jgi:hypothetical protein
MAVAVRPPSVELSLASSGDSTLQPYRRPPTLAAHPPLRRLPGFAVYETKENLARNGRLTANGVENRVSPFIFSAPADGSVDAMTRIISGFAGSLALAVPPNGTRPTSDRVREAIFSSLDARGVIQDARVLDLYAGSGALGLEAASRGARRVSVVERSQGAIPYKRRNAALLKKAATVRRELSIEV